MATKSFYPNIGTLVTIDDFPEELQFLEDGLQNALDKIYYKELQYVRSNDGTQGYYNIVLVTGEPLKLDLFGSGFSIVINPGGVGETLIPLTLNYNWPVLALINNFNIDNFSYLPEDLQDIFYKSLTLSDTDLIIYALDTFEGSTDFLSFQNFVDKINLFYSLSGSSEIPYPDDADILDMAEDVRWSIEGSTSITDSILDIINAIYIVSNDTNQYRQNLSQFSQNINEETIEDYIKKIILPKIDASLNLAIGLAFPRGLLVPLSAPGGEPIPDPEQSILIFDIGTLEFSTQGGINFQEEMAVSLNYPSQIGNTGLGIDIVNAKVDLSKNSNIIEADLDGRSQDFIGIYAQYVAITLPSKWFNNVDNTTLRIAGYNMLVGTGGVSGTIALETIGGQPNNGAAYMGLKIGDWELGFNYFDLTFKQNAVTQSNIAARVTLPKLKDNNDESFVYLNGHINEAGDFNLTASHENGIPFTLFGFVTFNFLTLELGRENDNFYVGTSCQIWFENQVMEKLIGDQVIEIPRLRVYDNGTVEIVGGNGFIPLNISLNLGPIEMAVTGVHYGSTQLEYNGVMRKYNYWGFDGAISIDPLGIDVRGDGIKYYYTTDNDETDEHGDPLYTDGDDFIHIKALEIDLVIPGTASPSSAIAIIHGMVALPDPGESPEYMGEISLKLPKAKIAGGAAMRLQPRYPGFLIDAFIDLPAPIPIGPLGIYGFRGLLGFRYVAEKEAVGLVSGQDTWYDYYVYPPKGIHVSKFSGPERTAGYTAPFSIGAGAVLGTSFDSGTVISVRAMLLLSLPTLFMVEGKASILSARLGLDDNREPPFFAFVAWGDNSIEMGMGADFNIPSGSGWILELYAEVQAGFFFNSPSAWYVNFGTKQNPISARVLTIVTAQTYLMLSAQGIEAGARVHFELKKRFGPAKIHLYAYIEVGGYISFERPQIGGYIAAGGGIDVDIWIIGISLSLNAIFSAEAAKPFLIYAEIDFRACVKLVFVKVCKSFTVKLKWDKDNSVDRTPVPPLPFSGTVDRTEELVKGIHMLTNEAFDLDYLGMSSPPSAGQITKVIPLDTYIEFKVEKGLVPGAVSGKIGGYTFAPENCVDLIPPQKVVRGGRELRQVKHRYSIEDIEIKAWNNSGWQDYHPFEAVVAPDDRPVVAGLRVGYWQIKEKQYDTIRLLATSPFNYMEAGEPGWHIPEIYGITPSVLYCQEELRTEDCSNVLNKSLGTVYYPPTQYIGHFINGAYYTLSNISGYEIVDGNVVVVENEYMEVTDVTNIHGFAKSLSFNNYNSMVIILPEPSVKTRLRLTTNAHGVTIKYYKSVLDDTTSLVQYTLIHQEYKTASQLDFVVEYDNEEEFISKVIIEPDDPNVQAMLDIMEQIAALFEATYDEAKGEVNITEPSDTRLYHQLLAQLEELKRVGCSEIEGDCNRDDILCELYDQLLLLFEQCFIYPVLKIEDLLKHQKCFNQFHELILIFDRNHPEYHLIESMGELYARFLELLESLNIMLNNYPGGISDTVIINHYYELREQTILILEYIKELGNCDCDDKPGLRCATSLQQICWMTLENHQWNETVPGSEAIEEDFEDMTAALQKVAQPVWRPNTTYYIRVQLKDEVDNGDSNPGIYNYYYGFKTVGPLGHYHKNPESHYIPSGAKADEYPLTSLRSYIDYNRSYPNADGNILKAKPLFYGNQQCKISVFFNKPLTYHMFQIWHEYLNMPELEGQLHIAVKDPVTDVIIPYPLPVDFDPGETVPVPDDGGYTWNGDNDPLLPAHIQVINNMIENGELPCEIDLGNPIVPASSYFTVTLTNLRPQKLYTALLYNAFEVTNNNVVNEPVHEFVFQTSRYLNFESQVKSYLIQGEEALVERQAVYNIELSLDNATVTKALDIVSNPANQAGDPLGNQFQHLFDRVIEGVFEIPPKDPPVRTEFHKIINLNTGNVVALLIKNPEPFNIPKIPLEELSEMIAVVHSNGNVDNAYKVLYSKDYSQAVIMRTSAGITAGTLNFRFKYYTWDGNQYEETDNVLAENININD